MLLLQRELFPVSQLDGSLGRSCQVRIISVFRAKPKRILQTDDSAVRTDRDERVIGLDVDHLG